ncbi:tRNA (cytosine(38)-C(5))-methyltransferase-like isoform X3 [Portunus trituberculatus]|uniref:tRNA (cytosine(38)-C(5))-methyltransferase-like isoform X3 n=1 Tax=Portunus trituberculatus TaxID=210409 RepID=UPI001E1CE6E3|nr:tRNA (cytosine(38)-C(5))-methyltransferase-like isoform X3 [Portunus trituberculatus]
MEESGPSSPTIRRLEKSEKMLQILELYSGIGGMQAAAKESGLPFNVVASYEINPVAVDVYCSNFPGTSKPRNILGLTMEELTRLSPDIIMMSPPCQPFTRQGLKRDAEDARSSSFLHLVDLLRRVPHPPRMILLENVAGYETSQTREHLVDMLFHRGYTWQEFLLSPTQFGVPNSRLRYYLLARLSMESFPFTTSQEVWTDFPFCLCLLSEASCVSYSKICCKCSKSIKPSLHSLLQKFHSSHQDSLQNNSPLMSLSLSHYLIDEVNLKDFLLPDKVLKKYHMLLDIVNHQSQRSCCFTKGYAHYVEGTGSVVQHNSQVDMSEIYSKVQALSDDDQLKVELLHQLELRYFTPEEVARLMCFPSWFTFPSTTTRKQRYKLLGNSINVLVVTCLLLVLVENQ